MSRPIGRRGDNPLTGPVEQNNVTTTPKPEPWSKRQIDGKRPSNWRRWFRIVVLVQIAAIILGSYLFVAYLVLPLDWMQYAYRHPAINDAPGITHTSTGIPGDPINVGLVGSEIDLNRAMRSAGWHPADSITLKSSIRIVADTVLKREYDDAPVSSLYLWGRKQDLAFEQPFKDGPRQRHHVRFWRSSKLDVDQNPMWFGAVTFDTRVGLSHTTGEITHHIDPDIDRERNKLVDDLRQASQLKNFYWIDGFQAKREGKNGGGDPFHTDGRLAVGVLDGTHDNQGLRVDSTRP